MKNFRSSFIGFIVGIIIMVPVTASGSLTDKVEATFFPNLKVMIDGEYVDLQSTPITVDGRTYLQLRDIGERVMGMNVDWEQESKTAILTSPDDDGRLTTELTEGQISKQESFKKALNEKYKEFFEYEREIDEVRIVEKLQLIDVHIRMETEFLIEAEKSADVERFPPYLVEVVPPYIEKLHEAKAYWQSKLADLQAEQATE